MSRIGSFILQRKITWCGAFACAILCPVVSPGESPATALLNELPPLETARSVGRTRSAFLNAEPHDQIPAPAGPATANLTGFQKEISPLLAESCVACHGPKKAKGKFRIDTLDPDLLQGGDIDWWLEVLDAVTNGEMPPDDAEVQLKDEDLARITGWLGAEIEKASAVRASEKPHSSFRRMTRYEYRYALQDLLGLSYSLVGSLPAETPSEDGFKNSSEMLQMSSMQFERYREIGLKALKHVTVSGERPKMVVYRPPGQNTQGSALDENSIGERHDLSQSAKKGKKAEPTQEGFILGRNKSSFKFNLSNHLPDEGIMRVTVHAGRSTMNADEFASLRLEFSAHTSNNANFSQIISERDLPVTASVEAPQVVHFDIPLSEIQRNPFRNNKEEFPRRDEFLTLHLISSTRGSREPLEVHLDLIEISAPFHEQWPPQTHRDIFIKSDHRASEQKYAREVLTKFLARAWRRPVTPDEVDPFVALFAEYRPDFTTLEEAMVEVLATVLATPAFLYLAQEEAPDHSQAISGLELASRLSFFLWSSIPDQELLELARTGALKEPAVLEGQVERMLADPRAARFSENFVHQWLGLDGLESVTHVKDRALLEAMQEEPIAFFNEVLHHNRSVMDFIHSDYVVVNERLAGHYRIPHIFGPHFREVAVKPEINRGGLLTGAAVLAMNSDGTDSHPLKRGVWILERVLHDPPPPPPPNVPEVDLTDPRILEMTLKERIADHRNNAACFSCHAKIDPWGIAFENYDALGEFRTKIKETPVDATSTLTNKQELTGMDGLKRYLLADRQDQFAGAMVHKLTSYALGRSLSFSDRAELASLTTQFRNKEDRLGDLIHLITQSKIFHAK